MKCEQGLDRTLPAEYSVINTLKPHRNICKIYHKYQQEENVDCDKASKSNAKRGENQKLVLILSYLPRTLAEFSSDIKSAHIRLPEVFLLQLLYQLLSTVYHLVMQGIVHNNISTDSVFLDSSLTPVLSGFEKSENVGESTDPTGDSAMSIESLRAQMYEMSLQVCPLIF